MCFCPQARKQDGELFAKNTIKGVIAGVQRSLRLAHPNA
jgi:hypothetical protein